MIILTEKDQKVYLKITNLIKKHSKLTKYTEEILTKEGRIKENFYKNFKTYLDGNFFITFWFALFYYLIYFLCHIINNETYQLSLSFMSVLIPLLILLTFISLNIRTYFKKKHSYVLSKKLYFEIFHDEDLKNIFLKDDLSYIIESIPDYKKDIFSDFKKIIKALERDNFSEKIGLVELVEEEKLKKLISEYTFILFKIKEHNSTSISRAYWKEKLAEFKKENKEYKKYFK